MKNKIWLKVIVSFVFMSLILVGCGPTTVKSETSGDTTEYDVIITYSGSEVVGVTKIKDDDSKISNDIISYYNHITDISKTYIFDNGTELIQCDRKTFDTYKEYHKEVNIESYNDFIKTVK